MLVESLVVEILVINIEVSLEMIDVVFLEFEEVGVLVLVVVFEVK